MQMDEQDREIQVSNLDDKNRMIAAIEERLESVLEDYAEWRRGESDAWQLAENQEALDRIDGLRREIISARADDEDHVGKMRFLKNWSAKTESIHRYEYETPAGIYTLTRNDVTHVWLVLTPDGALEGPFQDAQAAADWAADDWDECFSDPVERA